MYFYTTVDRLLTQTTVIQFIAKLIYHLLICSFHVFLVEVGGFKPPNACVSNMCVKPSSPHFETPHIPYLLNWLTPCLKSTKLVSLEGISPTVSWGFLDLLLKAIVRLLRSCSLKQSQSATHTQSPTSPERELQANLSDFCDIVCIIP